MKPRKLQTESARRFRERLRGLKRERLKPGQEFEEFREDLFKAIRKVVDEIGELEKRKRWLRQKGEEAKIINLKGGERQTTKFTEKEELKLLRRRARLANLLVLKAESDRRTKASEMKRLMEEREFWEGILRDYTEQKKKGKKEKNGWRKQWLQRTTGNK